MKKPNLLLLAACLVAFTAPSAAQDGKAAITFEMPLKTAIIKDPAATDASAYFSNLSILKFWVYKAGSTADVKRIITAFKEDRAVESVTEGPVTGDHKEFTVTMKSRQQKSWFIDKFRKAGIGHLKINNGQATEISKI